jgi:hypothetical protein
LALKSEVRVGTECLDDLAVQVCLVVPRHDLHAAVTVAGEHSGEGFVRTECLGVE